MNNSPKKYLFAVYNIGFKGSVASQNPQFYEGISEEEIVKSARDDFKYFSMKNPRINIRVYKIGTKIFDGKHDKTGGET